MKEISIIVPIINSSRFISDLTQSIISQTFKDFELIFVYNHSQDNSLEIIEKYEKEYDFIKVIKNKDNNIYSSNNVALDSAKGKWIMFINSHDWLTHNSLETLIEATSEADHVIGNISFEIDKKLIGYYQSKTMPKTLIVERLRQANLNIKGLNFPFASDFPITSNISRLYSKEIIDKNNIRFYEQTGEFSYRLFNYMYLKNIKRAKFSNDICYVHRVLKDIKKENYYMSMMDNAKHAIEIIDKEILEEDRYRFLPFKEEIFIESLKDLYENENKSLRQTMLTLKYNLSHPAFKDLGEDSYHQSKTHTIAKFLFKKKMANALMVSSLIYYNKFIEAIRDKKKTSRIQRQYSYMRKNK